VAPTLPPRSPAALRWRQAVAGRGTYALSEYGAAVRVPSEWIDAIRTMTQTTSAIAALAAAPRVEMAPPSITTGIVAEMEAEAARYLADLRSRVLFPVPKHRPWWRRVLGL